MAAAVPPMYTNTPLVVIATPQFETGETDPFTVAASHMALSHNAFIRGFNSIYQRAPRVPPAMKNDFVGYCIAWHACVAAHHRFEETELFPNLDKAASQHGLWGAAFHGGMGRFKGYLLEEGAGFSGTGLMAIMNSFKEQLHSHLKAEPPAIVALAKHSTAENGGRWSNQGSKLEYHVSHGSVQRERVRQERRDHRQFS
ncbi:hypothetical protein B0T26DRAFT_635089 [Lasiosphaeria miniovina]|uniref:Hemerythrin-like domain-containing protein n=1 Tax=Lasiosphaeria miniovina TaxID=1954250 RepID=A0AA40EG70_9PEZI|nr:uncharacterized protein B0T26DRAFT_635089 [Lasiosphaeria miniovina]KAK0734118.1 hypothetical protein B0T26DRAFT_635089 [Lasiosphaeria miniovina]